MKAGKIIRKFSAKNGRKVVLRTPRWGDLDDFVDFINSLVDEGASILKAERVSREEEIDWLSNVLTSLEKDEAFYMVAEVDKKVIANSVINRRTSYEKHVGVIGIAIRREFRDLGIGTQMVQTLTSQARDMGLKILALSAFATNEKALRLYEKIGFSQVGRIPKKFFKDGKYIDEILMIKILE